MATLTTPISKGLREFPHLILKINYNCLFEVKVQNECILFTNHRIKK